MRGYEWDAVERVPTAFQEEPRPWFLQRQVFTLGRDLIADGTPSANLVLSNRLTWGI
jgi:hypothetical protein